MKDNINIPEKIGDFLLNLILITIGGILFAAIMADTSISSIVLYISVIAFVAVLFIVALVLFRIGNRNKKTK